ncbi:MAG: DUF1848 domain-containing protein [Lachnospiraceae bacterium]|nr:DUF1848 domain-containing protein [Lachnospiraceae bacterium]
MIISASRRTDVPAYFSDWFLKRIQEGYAYVRNPMNARQVSRISLAPDVVDCIVFWSKNPAPLADKLEGLEGYAYYFQFTLNAYGRDMEENLPPLDERIDTFRRLSKRLGRHRVIWRYDPVILNGRYTLDWHGERFGYIADRLKNYTEKVTISFIDLYPKIAGSIRGKEISALSHGRKEALAERFAAIAHAQGLDIDTCAEDIDLDAYGIGHARCIDDRLVSRLLGCAMDTGKDKSQRPDCGCAASIDIGLYNTCQNGCVYCYANHSPDTRRRNLLAYDPDAPLLCGRVTKQDKVTERKVKSERNGQMRLFP